MQTRYAQQMSQVLREMPAPEGEPDPREEAAEVYAAQRARLDPDAGKLLREVHHSSPALLAMECLARAQAHEFLAATILRAPSPVLERMAEMMEVEP